MHFVASKSSLMGRLSPALRAGWSALALVAALTAASTTAARGGDIVGDVPLLTPSRVAALKALYLNGHPWAQNVQLLADWQDPYGDLGQWDTLMWVMTGNDAYARSAIDTALATFNFTPSNANETREFFVHWALHYAWLRSEMTLDERNEFRSRLRNWSEVVLDLDETPSFGTRLNDSDVVVGHHLGLAITAMVTATDPLIEDLLVAEPGPKGSSFADQKAAIAQFCALAEGGEWFESSAYNTGTMSLLFLGAEAVGMAQYPEVADLGPQVAEWLPWTFTPDGTQTIEWGDDSWPRNPELWSKVSLLGMLCGMGLDTTGSARGLLETLTSGVPPYDSYWYELYRPLYVFDPSSPLPAEIPPSPAGPRVSAGLGVVLHRGPDHLLHLNGHRRLDMDHEVHTNSDLKLWYKGEWVIDSPRGYDPYPNAVNAVMLSGLGPMWSRQLNSSAMFDRTQRSVWSTAGTYVGPDYYDPPPVFLNSYTRTVSFTPPNQLIVSDAFDGLDPIALGRLDRYYEGPRTAIQTRPSLWTVSWYCATEPVPTRNGYRWQTAGGRTVTLNIAANRGRLSTVVVKNSISKPDGYFDPSELQGWRIQIRSGTPQTTISSTLIVDPD